MDNTKKHIETIASVIKSTKENLKPLSINFIFWGIFVNVLSIFHYTFPSLVQSTKYSAILYWIISSIIGSFSSVDSPSSGIYSKDSKVFTCLIL